MSGKTPRLIWMQPHYGCTLLAITLSPRRQIIGGSVVPLTPPHNSSMPSCLRGAYTGAGLTADRGQPIITSDEYGGGPLGFRWSTAKNDNEGVHPSPPSTTHPPAATSSRHPLRDRPRSDLKVVTEAKRHRRGGSSRSSQSDVYLKKKEAMVGAERWSVLCSGAVKFTRLTLECLQIWICLRYVKPTPLLSAASRSAGEGF